MNAVKTQFSIAVKLCFQMPLKKLQCNVTVFHPMFRSESDHTMASFRRKSLQIMWPNQFLCRLLLLSHNASSLETFWRKRRHSNQRPWGKFQEFLFFWQALGKCWTKVRYSEFFQSGVKSCSPTEISPSLLGVMLLFIVLLFPETLRKHASSASESQRQHMCKHRHNCS